MYVCLVNVWQSMDAYIGLLSFFLSLPTSEWILIIANEGNFLFLLLFLPPYAVCSPKWLINLLSLMVLVLVLLGQSEKKKEENGVQQCSIDSSTVPLLKSSRFSSFSWSFSFLVLQIFPSPNEAHISIRLCFIQQSCCCFSALSNWNPALKSVSSKR